MKICYFNVRLKKSFDEENKPEKIITIYRSRKDRTVVGYRSETPLSRANFFFAKRFAITLMVKSNSKGECLSVTRSLLRRMTLYAHYKKLLTSMNEHRFLIGKIMERNFHLCPRKNTPLNYFELIMKLLDAESAIKDLSYDECDMLYQYFSKNPFYLEYSQLIFLTGDAIKHFSDLEKRDFAWAKKTFKELSVQLSKLSYLHMDNNDNYPDTEQVITDMFTIHDEQNMETNNETKEQLLKQIMLAMIDSEEPYIPAGSSSTSFNPPIRTPEGKNFTLNNTIRGRISQGKKHCGDPRFEVTASKRFSYGGQANIYDVLLIANPGFILNPDAPPELKTKTSAQHRRVVKAYTHSVEEYAPSVKEESQAQREVELTRRSGSPLNAKEIVFFKTNNRREFASFVCRKIPGQSFIKWLQAAEAGDLVFGESRMLSTLLDLVRSYRVGTKDNELIHADVKPDNFFANFTEKGNEIVLGDYGFARVNHEDDKVYHLGSPRYAAPEIYSKANSACSSANIKTSKYCEKSGCAATSPASDVFSLGKTFKVLLAVYYKSLGLFGEPSDTTLQLQRLITHMTATNPDHRPEICEVESRLCALISTQPLAIENASPASSSFQGPGAN